MEKYQAVLINSSSAEDIIYSLQVSSKINDAERHDTTPVCSLMLPDLTIAKRITQHSLSGSLHWIPAGKLSPDTASCADSRSSVEQKTDCLWNCVFLISASIVHAT